MISILYLIIATTLGWHITGLIIRPEKDRKLNLIWARLASSFGTGTLILTWPIYLTAYIFHTVFSNGKPLIPANAIVLGASAIALFFLFKADRKNAGKRSGALIQDSLLFKKEAVFYLLLLLFIWFNFHYVLHMRGSRMAMGFTVFSDYAPNIALIRSFSWFTNYPTQYPFFAGEDIKYHFMFMFLNGNMEFLGLPLTFAYNLTSTLSLFGFLVLLTQFALRVSGRFPAAILTAVFFFFRSGFALFMFIHEHLISKDLVHAFLTNEAFIGYTPNENWGLWNYNVYLNQRHLGFGLIIAATVVWYFYGYLVNTQGRPASAASAADYPASGTTSADHSAAAASPADHRTFAAPPADHPVSGTSSADHPISAGTENTKKFSKYGNLSAGIKDLFASKEAWLPKDAELAFLTGIILGLSSFWNGACVIGALMILAGFALFSRHKTDFLIFAVTAVLIAELQTKAFIFGSAVSPTFLWGFICTDRSIAGIIWFIAETTGLTIMGSLFLLPAQSRVGRCMIASFWLPVIFTFTVSLTPDVTVNHKYIMIAMAFFSVIWADVVTQIMSKSTIAADEYEEGENTESDGQADAAHPAAQPTGDRLPSHDRPIGQGRKLLPVPICAMRKKGRPAGRTGIGSAILAALLIVLLTATGFYDYIVILINNSETHTYSIDTDSDLTAYIREHLTYDDMVLSGPDSVSELTVSGCRLYCGWPYYAWSAGYDTDSRYYTAKDMYTVMSDEEVIDTMHKEGITYVLYEENLVYDDSPAREDPFRNCCKLVFTSSNGLYRLYKV